MLDGFGSDATHVAANPHIDVDCALDGNDALPTVVMLPLTGAGLLGTRAKHSLAEVPLVPAVPVGPNAPVGPNDPVGPNAPVGPVGPALATGVQVKAALLGLRVDFAKSLPTM